MSKKKGDKISIDTSGEVLKAAIKLRVKKKLKRVRVVSITEVARDAVLEKYEKL